MTEAVPLGELLHEEAILALPASERLEYPEDANAFVMPYIFFYPPWAHCHHVNYFIVNFICCNFIGLGCS